MNGYAAGVVRLVRAGESWSPACSCIYKIETKIRMQRDAKFEWEYLKIGDLSDLTIKYFFVLRKSYRKDGGPMIPIRRRRSGSRPLKVINHMPPISNSNSIFNLPM